jgi:hypothetical protein
MGITLSVPQQTTKFIRQRGESEGTERTEEEQALVVTPPKAGVYRFKVVAVSELFQMLLAPEHQKEGKTHSTKMRPEFEVTDGPGKGKRFEGLITVESIGPRSNLRKLWNAAGLEIPETGNIDVTDLIGSGEIEGYVNIVEKTNEGQTRRYANVDWDTLKPASDASDTDDTWEN